MLYSKKDPHGYIPNPCVCLAAYPTGKNNTSFTVPNGVELICQFSFNRALYLKTVTMPDSVVEIESNAFQFCEKLSSVKLGKGLRYIRDCAFLGTAIKEMYIPKLVSELGYYSVGYNYINGYERAKGVKLYCVKATSAENACSDYNMACAIDYSYISLSSAKLNAGAEKQLILSSAVKSCASSKKTVAIASAGKATALKKGTAKITATLIDGTKLTSTITVKTNPKLSKSSVTVRKGRTVKVKITGKAKSINNSYTNTKIAKIASKKTATTLNVKGLKKGKTTLRIKVNGVVLKLKVNVK